MPDSVTNASPAWLQAMLAQMYPGTTADMSMFGNPYQFNVWNKMMPDTPQGAGGKTPDILSPIQGADPRNAPASGFGRPAVTARPANSPGGTITPLPPPDPRRVGGAPAPAIPAPQNFNRTANNPDYPLVQYGVPGSGRGGANPIYTSHMFNLFGGSQPQQQAALPRGVLSSSAPQTPQMSTVDPRMGPFDSRTAWAQAQKFGWPFPMIPNPQTGYEPGGSNV